MMIPHVLRSVSEGGVGQVVRGARGVGALWGIAVTGAVLGTVGVAGLAGLGVRPAHAEPLLTPPPGSRVTAAGQAGAPGERLSIDTPHEMYATPPTAAAVVSQTLHLERCRGGCVVQRGINDARVNTSTIPMQQTSMIGEFRNNSGTTGALADADWNALVQCMREVYSPFNVTVTDVKPAPGVPHHQAIVAGVSDDIALGNDQILGVAPLANDCSAIDNVISFTFANAHPANPLKPDDRIFDLCWTVAQESAHAFGLDHEYSFTVTNRSACNDPMTYRNDCGGQKFFRNELAACGENTARPCKCGQHQNSHIKLLSVFGPATPITGNPTIEVSSPRTGGMLDRAITVRAGSKRGISRVELWFNGYKWTEEQGLRFGDDGQANPGDYAIVVPTALPDSIVDIKLVAYDDLGASTETTVANVTKGAACQSAASCATGQRCEAGKCFWDPPAGELGEDCEYPQFCKTGLCRGTSERQVCTQECLGFVDGSCPSGLECVVVAENDDAGICFPPETGGCCSVDRSGRGWLAHAALAALVLGFVIRRRRR
jgi:hypothetical protein